MLEQPAAAALCRGVCRGFGALGYACLTEFPLANGRRADVIALGRGGDLVIVEVKSSVADLRADRKWPEYWDFCDRLFFAVAEAFPKAMIPAECGLIIADGFGATTLRDIAPRPLAAARRKAVTLRFARAAAARLRRMVDPASVELAP